MWGIQKACLGLGRCKHEGPSADPQSPRKAGHVACVCNPSVRMVGWELETGRSLDGWGSASLENTTVNNKKVLSQKQGKTTPMVKSHLERHLYWVCCSQYPCPLRFFSCVIMPWNDHISMARQHVLRVLCPAQSHCASSCYINNRKLTNPQSMCNVKAPVPMLIYRTACSKVVWLH